MYNRYIPPPDGSFLRNRVPDRSRPSPPPKPQPEPCGPPGPEPIVPPAPEPCPPKKPPCQPKEPPKQEHRPRRQESPGNSIGGFFRQLLPKDLDTSDLLIILLLLLMAGDCAEDQNTALLTLALYLFM